MTWLVAMGADVVRDPFEGVFRIVGIGGGGGIDTAGAITAARRPCAGFPGSPNRSAGGGWLCCPKGGPGGRSIIDVVIDVVVTGFFEDRRSTMLYE